MEKISIIPRTLVKFSMDSELLESTRELVFQEEFRHSTTNEISKNYYLLREERYKKLTDWVNSCLEEIRLDFNYICDSLKITQSWANRSSYGQYHHDHIHPNSMLSGIIYLTKSSAPTLFGFENEWYFMTRYEKHPNLKLSFDIGKSALMGQYDCTPGDMIIFPSSFRHSTLPHDWSDENRQTDKLIDRITISFNVFPNGKIGILEDLAGLEIEVK